jgi:hypothetical protein
MEDLTVLGGLHSRYGILALEKGSRFGCMTSSVRRVPRCRLFDSTLIFNRGWSVCCILSIVRTGNASLRRWRAGRRAENRIRGLMWLAPLLVLNSILGSRKYFGWALRDGGRVDGDGFEDGYGLGRSLQNPLCMGSIPRNQTPRVFPGRCMVAQFIYLNRYS